MLVYSMLSVTIAGNLWRTWFFAGFGSFAGAMLPPSPGLLPPSPQGLPGMQTPEAAAEDAGRHTAHHSHITLEPDSDYMLPHPTDAYARK
jgi:hypothetical protein